MRGCKAPLIAPGSVYCYKATLVEVESGARQGAWMFSEDLKAARQQLMLGTSMGGNVNS